MKQYWGVLLALLCANSIELMGAGSMRRGSLELVVARSNTPLYLAIQSGNVVVAEFFLKNAGLIEEQLRYENGNTLWHLLVESFVPVRCREYMAIASLLKKFNFSFDLKNEIGQTPLHLAIKHGILPLIVTLLQYGADPRAVELSGLTLD